jgi:hypothetical protein
MNRHSRKRFYKELDAYLAFFAVVAMPTVQIRIGWYV